MTSCIAFMPRWHDLFTFHNQEPIYCVTKSPQETFFFYKAILNYFSTGLMLLLADALTSKNRKKKNMLGLAYVIIVKTMDTKEVTEKVLTRL